MPVKVSVSISDQQHAFARKLVEDGRYASLSAVQRGLELLREETELKDAERAAPRRRVEDRMTGEFLTMEESDRQIAAMIEANRRAHGL